MTLLGDVRKVSLKVSFIASPTNFYQSHPMAIKRTILIIFAFALTTLMAGCTSMNVKKIDASQHAIKLVCIEENSEVLVEDLLSVIETEFQKRNIQTLVYKDKSTPPSKCEYTLWYQAWRGWDLAPFLRRVELRLKQGDITVANATYNHSGGLALNKWASTESKMQPVFEELLADFQPTTRNR